MFDKESGRGERIEGKGMEEREGEWERVERRGVIKV